MRYCCSLGLLALIGFAAKGNSQTMPQNETEESPLVRFSTKLDLVVLNAAVRNRKGGFVPDLTEPDFKVYEDNVLADNPVIPSRRYSSRCRAGSGSQRWSGVPNWPNGGGCPDVCGRKPRR